MATSKKFSELPAASSVGNGDLFAIAHEDAQAETGYVSQKLTAAQAGQKMNGDTEYPTSLPSFPENSQNPFAALEKLNQDIIDLYPVNTASGSIATFSTSLALPLVACEAEIVAQQAGSGTPSPSNPRAISGYDSITLTHEYNVSDSDTYSIALPETIYGGNVNLTEGTGVKTLKIYDFGDLEWTYINGAFRVDFPDGKISGVAGKDAFGMCEVFNFRSNTVLNASTISDWDNYDFAKTATLSASRYYFKDTNYTDANSFKNAYTGKKIIIDLSTPTTFTFTPEQILTLSGENNIFSDCGEVSVGFKQGIQEYIDAQIAATQALIL